MNKKLLLLIVSSAFLLVGCCDGETFDWEDLFGTNNIQQIEEEEKVEIDDIYFSDEIIRV